MGGGLGEASLPTYAKVETSWFEYSLIVHRVTRLRSASYAGLRRVSESFTKSLIKQLFVFVEAAGEVEDGFIVLEGEGAVGGVVSHACAPY